MVIPIGLSPISDPAKPPNSCAPLLHRYAVSTSAQGCRRASSMRPWRCPCHPCASAFYYTMRPCFFPPSRTGLESLPKHRRKIYSCVKSLIRRLLEISIFSTIYLFREKGRLKESAQFSPVCLLNTINK